MRLLISNIKTYLYIKTVFNRIQYPISNMQVLIALHTKSKQFLGVTWALWLTAVSFLLGPFWFNPVSFEWDKLAEVL